MRPRSVGHPLSITVVCLLFGAALSILWSALPCSVNHNSGRTAPSSRTAPDCDDGLFCNGVELERGGSCLAGPAPCPGRTCDEDADACVDAVITLNPSTTYQTIEGWEATSQVGQDESPAFEHYKDELYDQAVNDLGINRLRLEVRSGAENVEDYWRLFQAGLIPERDAPGSWRDVRYSTINDNPDPFDLNMTGFHFSELDHLVDTIVLPVKQRVEQNRERLYINLSYVAFTAQIGESGTRGLVYIHNDPEEYAEFVLATYIHLRDTYGWVPDSWEVILEPDNVAEWNGVLIGRAIAAAAARLQAHGFTPSFIAPSTMCLSHAVSYFDDLISIPDVLPFLSEISYHRYCGVSDGDLAAIAARAVANNLNAAMLEHMGSGADDLHQDLKTGRNAAWQQFALAWITSAGGTDDGSQLYLIDDSDVQRPTVSLSSRARFLRQYFRFIRRSAVRIEATSTQSRFDPLAFQHPNGRVVVVIRSGDAGVLAIRGLPPGSYGIKFTTDSQFDADGPTRTIGSGASLVTGIPARGILTIYSLCAAVPENCRVRDFDKERDVPPPSASILEDSFIGP